jgi:sn-glycerol 3-phosphate transport system permease protein
MCSLVWERKKYIISKGREDNMEESTSSIVIRKTGHILNVCLKLCIIVVIAFPFYWMVSTSLKDYTEALQFPPTLFPKTVHWENYTHVFEIVPIGLYFRNSVVVSLLVLVLQYLIIVPAAYSFARHEYFGKNLFFGIVLLGLMIPQQITFLPVYFMFSKMRLLKTFIPLVLPFISNPFGIFMLRQYFMQIPQEVIEAARLDDAGNMKIMFKVMMPMAKPALITIGLLSFISTWNSYFWPLIMTSSETFRTLPVGIAALKSSETLQMWHIIMAGNVVLVIPILLVYMFASKKIRNSFVYSGIK